MNTAQALHNAARHYCLEKHRYWCEVYSTLPNGGRASDNYNYSSITLDTFPRYNVLNAIRVAIESIDPDKLSDFPVTKSLIAKIGYVADDDLTRNSPGQIAERAQSQERERFCDFIMSLTELDIWNYEALPYRRVLSRLEADAVWSALESKWGIAKRSYWFPLAPPTVSSIAAFRADKFHQALPGAVLRRRLQELGIDRIWEMREYGPEYLEDVEFFEPFYNFSEGYWTSQGHKWVVYASHESSVTVAGLLLAEIERIWPESRLHRC